jgi:hypothetical protein
MSGESESSIHGGCVKLIDKYFNGDEEAFINQNVMNLRTRRSFPDTAGMFVLGVEGSKHGSARPWQRGSVPGYRLQHRPQFIRNDEVESIHPPSLKHSEPQIEQTCHKAGTGVERSC